MYSGDAAEARGARICPISWTPPDLTPDTAGPWVSGQVEPVLDKLAAEQPPLHPLLIAKSLGTHAAALAADRQLPAAWLTPVLTADWVVAALRRASAPCLLVGGTADKLWDGGVARKLSSYVLEVADADHGMYVPGPLAASAAVLGRVATAVEEFLDDVVWPSRAG